MHSGTLYIVATPIGNLEDISARALRVLREADLILAEDTRVSRKLLGHYGIATPVGSLHANNEHARNGELLEMLINGKRLALISDAGTPLISDPGFLLVRSARAKGIHVVPVPGPCAAIAALSASALPCDRFAFEGFLPSSPGGRRRALEGLRHEARTMIFYEAPHRLTKTIDDLTALFGPLRPAALARELSKLHEIIVSATLAELSAAIARDADQCRGEIVLCVAGAENVEPNADAARRTAAILRRYLPVGRAAAATSELTGSSRKSVYTFLLSDPEEPPA